MKPEVDNVVIVGLGLIGGSVGIEIKQSQFAKTVVGVDENKSHQDQALSLNLVDSVENLDSALKKADLVILTIPVTAIHQLLPRVLDLVSPTATVTDMGSSKKLIADSVKSHGKRKQLVLSHPMAGTENSGPTAAQKGLFQNKTAVICDAESTAAPHLQKVNQLYQVLGMRVINMTSQEHDMHAAFVSHLSHISSFVLANTVLDIEKNVASIFDMAGGGFESTVRLAKSSPEMWLPIFEQNQENITKALSAYIRHLQVFQDSLIQKRWDETRSLLEKANGIRRVLKDLTTKGAGAK